MLGYGAASQQTPTLAERAAGILREEIITGILAPGSRIKAEKVAERLDMSPIPVREALQSLASSGLLVLQPRRGYRVPEISEADLLDTYRLRIVLDPMAVELAVPRLSDAELAEIEGAYHSLVAAYEEGDWAAHLVHHRRFHHGIYAACGSPWLLRFINMLWQSSERYQRLSIAHRGGIVERSEEHRRILVACQQRDAAGAARLAREHLELTPQSVMRLLPDPHDQPGPTS